jgi:hypothetical protein
MGHTNPPTPESRTADTPYGLEKIYDSQLEALAAKAYQRDYVKFGFDAWR